MPRPLLALLALLWTVQSQCSAYCSKCIGSYNNGENTNCQQCPSYFNFVAGTNGICQPLSSTYGMVLQSSVAGDITPSNGNTGGCGSLFGTKQIAGRF